MNPVISYVAFRLRSTAVDVSVGVFQEIHGEKGTIGALRCSRKSTDKSNKIDPGSPLKEQHILLSVHRYQEQFTVEVKKNSFFFK